MGRTRSSQSSGSLFRVKLSDVLVGPSEAKKRTIPKINPHRDTFQITFSPRLKLSLTGIFTILVLILSADPPGGQPYRATLKETSNTGVMISSYPRYQYWIMFGIRYFVSSLWYQLVAWIGWVLSAFQWVDD
ncbi:hypothetical protein RSAG8_12544, partial [Rhizoctonia solani AG-8 WAC10335]